MADRKAYLKKIKGYYASPGLVRDMSRTSFLSVTFSTSAKSTSAIIRPKLVRSLIAPAVRGNVLEVGIGAGPLVEKLRKLRKVSIYGVDISPPLLKKARERGAVPLLSAGEHLPLKRNVFDSAISLDTLGHIENPGAVLREIRRVLKPGGRIVINVSEKGPYSEAAGGTGELRFKSFEKGEIRELFKRSGLRIEKIKKVGVVPLYPKNLFIYARKPSLRTFRRKR
jgi:ubiquinone/menaquinone biosynthesis C-methylase UbiE